MRRALGFFVAAACAVSVVACGGKVLGESGDDTSGDDDVVTHPPNQGADGGTDAQKTDAAKPDDPEITALRAKEGQIAYVYFQPETDISENVPPSHNVLLEVPSKAQDIYDTTLSLPRPPSGVMSCPADFGVYYDLQFFAADDSLVAEVQVQPGGCENATFVESDLTLQADGSPYFATLASDLGLEEKDIYPYVPQGTP